MNPFTLWTRATYFNLCGGFVTLTFTFKDRKTLVATHNDTEAIYFKQRYYYKPTQRNYVIT